MAPQLPRTVAILGAGAVGGVLLPALRAAGVRIVAAWSRTARPPLWRSGQLPRAIREAELILLAVSDASVQPVCEQLVAEGLVGKGQLVVHLAGSLDLAPLHTALHAGAQVGSFHPLRAVPPGSRADAFAGAMVGVDGSDDVTTARLWALAQTLAMKPLIARGDRSLYHSAAVLASGSMVALFAEAARAFQAATNCTEAEAREALLPLSRGALQQLEARPPGAALTGPVARGDAATVAAHLAALEPLGVELSSLYWLLSLAAVRLSSGRIGTEALQAVAEILDRAGQALLASQGEPLTAAAPAPEAMAKAKPAAKAKAGAKANAKVGAKANSKAGAKANARAKRPAASRPARKPRR